MAIKVGCFALINPFSPLENQLDQIKKWGFTCGDLTDNSDGAFWVSNMALRHWPAWIPTPSTLNACLKPGSWFSPVSVPMQTCLILRRQRDRNCPDHQGCKDSRCHRSKTCHYRRRGSKNSIWKKSYNK